MAKVAASARIIKEKISRAHDIHISSFQEDYKRILFVTSELADLIKVGGLGDVSAALPRALAGHHDIRILIPGYREVMSSGLKVKLVGKIASCSSIPQARLGRIDLADGLIVYVVICPELYEREGQPYGDNNGQDWPDNPVRFALLGHAAAEIAARQASISWQPQLVHANDWPAGLAPAYMALRGIKTPSIFTIHNLMHRGIFSGHTIDALGLSDATDTGSTCTDENILLEGHVSFLKAGVVYASHITTVSKTYAEEITGAEFGCGLHDTLKIKSQQGLLSGIVNGIDESWNPLTDPHLLSDFGCWEREGKTLHAQHVAERFNLDKDSGPLFAVVSRLVHQKGIDLSIEATNEIIAAGGKLVIMGRGEPKLEVAMTELQTRHPGRVATHIGFNERDARRIYAASDFLLMPSRFEPCGLSQMYAQKMGSLPIARRTGGLADTIQDGLNGFLFEDMNIRDYINAIRRAVRVYQRRELLRAMRHNAMGSPIYWHQSVKPYDELYKKLVNHQRLATANH